MIRFVCLSVLLLSVLTPSYGEDEGFVSLFNGTDLAGWDGEPGSWHVVDGAIATTGESDERNWLIWREDTPGDFILKLEFRYTAGNSGVQVRSDDLGDWKVFGYQVEVASQDKMGLWHHSLLDKNHPTREARHLMATAGQTVEIDEDGKKTVTEQLDAETIQAHFDPDGWNELEILAKGDTLIQKINGVVFSTVIDRDREMSRRDGLIALQDHGGHCLAAFRNLRIKRLP